MLAWLEAALLPRRYTLLHAAVFGSVAAGSRNPGDCDLVLVSSVGPDNDEWHALRNSLQPLYGGFFVLFGIPLSVVLLTAPEWGELEGFFKQGVPLFGDPLTRPCSQRGKCSHAFHVAEGSCFI